MFIKRILVLALALALALSCGCGAQVEESSNVWVIAKSTESEFFRSVFDGAKAAAAAYNASLTIVGPDYEEDVQAQNDYIDQAVEEGAQAIVLSAISFHGNAAAVERAAAAGVKVVSIDSDVDAPSVSARIGTNNQDAGRKAAMELLRDQEEDLVVGLINVSYGAKNCQEREEGARAVLGREARVRRIFTINIQADLDQAQAETRALLEKHPEINALIGFNEQTAVGAGRAVEELGLEDKVAMVGFDSNVHTVDMMQTGAVRALVVQNPYAMGYLGVETACGLVAGRGWAEAVTDTSTLLVRRDTMFDLASQKVLFSFQ